MKSGLHATWLLLGLTLVFSTGCVEVPRWGDDPKDDLTGLKKAINSRDWMKAINYYEDTYAQPNLKDMRTGRYFLRPYPDHPDAQMYPVAPDDEGYSTDILGPNDAYVKFFRLIDKKTGLRRPVKIRWRRIDGYWKIIAELDF
ncbi:MAG: hypothetical protein ACYS8W_03845 [Planctomycetota bacterium]|jgi:hypothetical protein